MHRWLWMMVWWAVPASGQDKACSALREIAYHLLRTPPDALIESERRRTDGRRADGGWVWRTTAYNTTINWPGSAPPVLEHYEDQRDTLRIDSWQYLVSSAVFTDKQPAEAAFLAFARQVQGCVLPDSDSSSVVLAPASPDELPLTKPDDLDSLLLFTIPDAAMPGQNLLLMAGLERLRKGWRALLIMEAYREEKWPDGTEKPRPDGASTAPPAASIAAEAVPTAAGRPVK